MKIVLVALALLCCGATNVEWSKGKVIDVQRYSTHAGKFRAQSSYCLALQMNDAVYLARYEPVWRGGYNPARLVIGDEVESRVEGDHLFIRKNSGDAVKTSIDRREKLSAKPTTCAERVQN